MPRKAYSLFICLIAVFTATGAHALSCVSSNMMPEDPLKFEGVMVGASKASSNNHMCSYRYQVRVEKVHKGELEAGEILHVTQKHWVCPQQIEWIGKTKTYALPLAKEGVHEISMCDGLFFYDRTQNLEGSNQ